MSDETEEEKEIETADVQVIAFCMLVSAIFIGYCYERYNRFEKIERFFPHASANMVFGVIVGAVIALLGQLSNVFSFDSEFFFVYLLPPIIFNAGYTIPKDFFFHNFGSIVTFAFIGTTLSAFFIGGLLYVFGLGSTQDASFTSMDFTKCMMLGSLISAVDPVAVILVLKSLSVDEQLKIILFGESVLNDAASVVINRVFVSIESDERTVENALGLAVFEIIGISVASILIGVICALFVAFIHKRSRIDNHKQTEMASFLLGAFIPYAVAESLDLSGIMAVLFAGIMSDYYISPHLSRETQISSRGSVQTLSYLCESFVFIYLGMSFFLEENHQFRGSFITVTVILCFLGRAISVFPLAYLLNFRRKHKIPFKHQIVLWFSGLRGPVAYALAVATPIDDAFPDAKNIIISTTLFIVAFTTLLLGGGAYPFLKCLKVPLMDSTKAPDSYEISNHWFNKLDAKLLKPWFGPVHRAARPDNPMSNAHVELQEENTLTDNNNIVNNNNNNTQMNSNNSNELLSTTSDGGHVRKLKKGRPMTSMSNSSDLNIEIDEHKIQPIKGADRDDYSMPRSNNHAPSFLENPREVSRSTTWSEANNQTRDPSLMDMSTRLDLPSIQQTRSVTPPPNKNDNNSPDQ